MAKRRRKPELTGRGRTRIAAWLPPETIRRLDQIAERRGCSRSDLIVSGADLIVSGAATHIASSQS
jgi:hypothetical protein